MALLTLSKTRDLIYGFNILWSVATWACGTGGYVIMWYNNATIHRNMWTWYIFLSWSFTSTIYFTAATIVRRKSPYNRGSSMGSDCLCLLLLFLFGGGIAGYYAPFIPVWFKNFNTIQALKGHHPVYDDAYIDRFVAGYRLMISAAFLGWWMIGNIALAFLILAISMFVQRNTCPQVWNRTAYELTYGPAYGGAFGDKRAKLAPLSGGTGPVYSPVSPNEDVTGAAEAFEVVPGGNAFQTYSYSPPKYDGDQEENQPLTTAAAQPGMDEK